MIRIIATSIILFFATSTLATTKDTLHKFDIGLNLIINKSSNPYLTNGISETTYGFDLVCNKNFSNRISLSSGISILEKSLGDDGSFVLKKFTYAGVPLLFSYKLLEFNRLDVKIKSGPVLEYLVYIQRNIPELTNDINKMSISVRGQMDIEFKFNKKVHGLVNLNFIQGLNQDQLTKFMNYGIGIGMIRKINT